ncbi:hypothetical protein B0H65DRAFT_505058 [Neurospora tetraspora]|uniref:Uncharacterized protein n=1 Tax=Neurospora tetraspora TaxID=94610 RepID=A0AAE0JP47_9PEZI|nr:hypothetical protein B0H65DRAFT_505058 [Neurospora tetraspora]
MAGNKSKADGMRPNKGSAKSTSGVQSAGASATEPSRFLFKTATAPNAETAPASTPRNPFVLPSVAPANGPKSSFTTTTTEKKTHKPLSKEEYLAQAERRYQASRDRADAELRKLYQTTCPFAKRAVKRYAQRRSQWAESRKRLQKAGAFLENTMGTLSNAHTLKNSRPSASASKHLQKTSPQVSPEPSSAKPHALPQISFSVDDHRNNDSSKAPSVTSSSDETVKSDTRTVDSLSTNITTPDLSDCDSLVKSVTKSTKQKTTSSSAAVTPSQTKADIVTEKPTPKAEKFKITINVEAVASSKESKSSTQKTKEDAGPTTTSGALTPKKSVDQKHEKKQKSSSDKQDGQELQKEKEKKLKADAQPASEMKKSKKHKRDEDDQSEGATEQPKAKKSKTSAEPPTCSGAAMTPAAIDKSYKPYPNVPPEIRKELFVIKVQEMLDNPLGYDDLVYDDNRPKSKRPKWRKTGRNTGHNDMMMSGGIGPADPSSGSHKSGKGGANKKNRSGGDDSLSKQVLKKGHNKRVAEEVASLKKSSVAAESGSSFGEKREKEFKKNKHGHQNGQGQKNWKHKPNQSGSLAAKFRKHK